MSNAEARPLNIVKRDDLMPLCPHCGQELSEIYAKSQGAGFVMGKDTMYFCPHCSKVLGFAQSRMI
ncbi:MAG: hypothetical protein QNI99_08450 [Woeseiaceae bacterium]|nr:hypothetical protein [Woeseiaceae bacterium]